MPMQNQECVGWCQGQDNVEESLVTSGRVWRPGRMLPQGRSYGWRWTEAKSAKIPTVICQGCSEGLAWWYQAWRCYNVKDTRTDGRRSRRRCCHRLKWPGGDSVLDQGLAKDNQMYNATAQEVYNVTGPNYEVFMFFKARRIGLAGRLPSWPRECIDKIRRETRGLTRQSRSSSNSYKTCYFL